MQIRNLKKIGLVFLIVFSFIFVGSCWSSHAKTEESVIYTIRLKSLDLHKSIMGNINQKFAAKGSNTYVYISILVDGKPFWYSNKLKVTSGQTHFDWPNDLSAFSSIFWNPGVPISIKAFLSDDPVEAASIAGVAGVIGGAGAGATIGGLIAGLLSGGLGAPAGAAIGAAIGGVVGGAGLAATGAISAQDTVVFEKHFDKVEEFPLLGDISVSKTNALGELVESRISFVSESKMEPVGANQLELQKKYLVRVKEIHLSAYAWQKGGKDLNENRYYMILKNGDTTIRWPENKKEYFSYKSQMLLKPELLVVLANSGEETEIVIYSKRKLLKDKLVFSSKVAKLDGKNWVFQGESYPSDTNDRSSKIVCATYGPLR